MLGGLAEQWFGAKAAPTAADFSKWAEEDPEGFEKTVGDIKDDPALLAKLMAAMGL
jgi:hypothetical protein